MDFLRFLRDPDEPEDPFVPDLSEGPESGLYLALLELLDEGLIITSDETILEANSAACRLLERNYRDLVGKPLSDLFPSEKAFLDARARMFIQGEMRGTLQLSLPHGGHRELRCNAAARLRPGIHALILSPDYLAEASASVLATATPDSDTVWPRLAAALEQPVIVLDGEERVAAANAAALRSLQIPRQDLVGKRLSERLTVSWPAPGAEPFARLELENGARQFQARILPGPKPGWRLLIVPPEQDTPSPEASPRPAPPPVSSSPDALPEAEAPAAFERTFGPCPLPALLVSTPGMEVLGANPAAGTFLGVGASTLKGRPLGALGYRQEEAEPLLWRVTDHQGHSLEAELLTYPLEPGLSILLHDLPERPLLSSRLRLPAHVIEASPEAIMVCDGDWRIQAVNQAFTRITGHTPAEVRGHNPDLLRSERHDQAFYDAIHATLDATGRWEGEIWNRRKNGEIYPEWLAITLIRGRDGQALHYVAVFSDLTVRRQADARSDYLANHDLLSGLPNLRFLAGRFDEAAARCRAQRCKLAIIKIDLDQFKSVNQAHGHHAGDQVLRMVALRLRGVLSEPCLVARKRSDSFIALIPDIELLTQAHQAADRLRAALDAPLEVDGHAVQLSASLGVALCPDDGTTLEVLLGHANIALQQVRGAGGSGVGYYADEMNADTLAHQALEASLRQAIERQELEVHFVPEWRAAHPQVPAAEALLRWRHPDLGLIPTRRLLPLAKESGLIVPLGEWVLRQACLAAQGWAQLRGVQVPLVINVAVEQLASEGFLERVAAILQETGIDPAQVELDLEEAVLADQSASVPATLLALRTLGLRLAIDNFGQGLIPLRHLRALPVERLRLNADVARDSLPAPEYRAVVEALLAMAQTLGLEAVAKGVDDQERRTLLLDMGFPALQGRLVGGPVPADRFAEDYLLS
ncbi:MAG: EAL domain-containing protein [Rhodocyclaceae bacterium]|jgi:diguanylate cyclase (GGDEF)-like protein/PAS domain S-box-containing protein|nr:EAL domain-containing protein [Rhodocyclaceae bacterium]